MSAPCVTGRTASVAVVAALGMLLGSPAAAESPLLRVDGMTFVGSRGSEHELVLRARTALFSPDRNVADLEGVRATLDDGGREREFVMTCDRGELNVDTYDFTAEGNVKGVTRHGQRYEAPWVSYEHEAGLLYSDAPVVMVDETGTFRGDGFRYFVRDGRFKLIGHVSVRTQ